MEKQDLNIGLMLLLLENAHATALLSHVMNLVKEAGEHWNPNQTPVLMMDQLLSAIAKEIQWLWSDSFSNNKYVIMTGGWGWGLHVEMAWRVVEWCWVARCNHNCWNSVAEFFVKVSCEDKKCPPGYSCSAAYSAAECLPFLCAV